MASIYWRGTKQGGAYYSQLRIQGKLIRNRLSRDKRIAEDMLADLIKDREALRSTGNGIEQDISWPVFKEKFLSYIGSTRNGRTPQRILASIRSLERYNIPRKVSDVTVEFIENFIAFRQKNKISPTTIITELAWIKVMMDTAKKWGFKINIDWEKITRPRSTERNLLFWSPKEIPNLLKTCREFESPLGSFDWATIFLLGLCAGLRRSEILNLHKTNVDFNKRIITVSSTDSWRTKTGRIRHIPMADHLFDHLKSIDHKGFLVIGVRPEEWQFDRCVNKIIKVSGLKGTFHTSRHTFASHLVQANVPLYTVSKLLGHSDLKTTEIYAHLAPETYQSAIARLPDLN